MPKKTVSPKQLTANRRNASHSTGPISAQGKTNVSRNAATHGLTAGEPRINQEHEHAEFQRLRQGLMSDYQPKEPAELLLVERLATCYWRLHCLYRFEADSIRKARDAAQSAGGDPLSVVLPDPDDLETFIRYESVTDHEINHLIKRLHSLRDSVPRR